MNRFTSIDTYIETGQKAQILKRSIYDYLKQQDSIAVLTLFDFIIYTIKKLGCTPKFPPNINGPYVAAHDTADVKDNRIFKSGVISIDLGIVYKDCIIDTAFTYCLNTSTKLQQVQTCMVEFFQYIQMYLKPGLHLHELAKLIEDYYTRKQLYILPSLCGHTINPPYLHTEPTIIHTTNMSAIVDTHDCLKEGQLFTIEPHVALQPTNIIEKPAKIYKEANSNTFTSRYMNPNLNTRNAQPYAVLAADTEHIFLKEHTYLVLNDKVIRLS